MPKNDEQALSTRAQAQTETALEKYEREQLTRRQALRKFGITSAMATFALFSVDDLARMVGKAMQQKAADNKVAAQIAMELRNAGVALASGPSGCPTQPGKPSNCCPNYDCSGCGGSAATGDCCFGSSNPNACCGKSYGQLSANPNITACQQCCEHATGWPPGSQYWNACNDYCGGITSMICHRHHLATIFIFSKMMMLRLSS